MIKKALVLDYKTGNVDSVIQSCKNVIGYDVIFSSEKKDSLTKSIKISGFLDKELMTTTLWIN